METLLLPVLLFAGCAGLLAVGLVLVGKALGPTRSTPVKQMPYESGMDPVHDTRRRFGVRFYLVAIAFLIFDVELLFLYPWAVASAPEQGGGPGAIDQAVSQAVAGGFGSSRELIFGGVLVFLALVVVGFIYEWRKGVLQWR